jgi:hypothetical protein
LERDLGVYTAISSVRHRGPRSYEVDALRDLMLINGVTQYGLLTDFGVLNAASALLTAIGARMYARMAY